MLSKRKYKKSKKGVSTVVATVLLVMVTVVLAGLLYSFVAGLMKAPTYLPQNVNFYDTLQPVDGHSYLVENVSIMSTSTTLQIDEIGFSVKDSYGNPFSTTNAYYFTIVYWNATGKYMGQYNIYSTSSGTGWIWDGNILGYQDVPIYVSTTTSGNVPLEAGGWLELIWYSQSSSPPQPNYYGYSLGVNKIMGLAPINGAISLQ